MWISHLPNFKRVVLTQKPKKIIVSGPSGFLGKRVIKTILELHNVRKQEGLEPGELILLSSSPGNLMAKLGVQYNREAMKSIRGSRVDYFTQHCPDMWVNHLGSLGLGGEDCVFINLAATAGPVDGISDAMEKANYHAPVAAAKAAKELKFSHFVQSSSQATMTERSGQVPYSRWKGMCDHALSRLASGDDGFNVTIARLGLLYCNKENTLGQSRNDNVPKKSSRGNVGSGSSSLNLADLSLLPLTPIMGSGQAPLQPQEVRDAARRIAWLAMSNPTIRPHSSDLNKSYYKTQESLRIYDAVGPETITILQLLEKFSKYQGRKTFKPVFIDYRSMEEVVNVKALGNLNRQFISILRSEQDGFVSTVADPTTWSDLMMQSESKDRFHGINYSVTNSKNELLLKPQGVNRLLTLEEAFATPYEQIPIHYFPYWKTILHILNNPGVIEPGLQLGTEILRCWWQQWGEDAAEDELVEIHFPPNNAK